ncbi:hypothetical protein KIPB_008509, partial [Kipferlia bialata]
APPVVILLSDSDPNGEDALGEEGRPVRLTMTEDIRLDPKTYHQTNCEHMLALTRLLVAGMTFPNPKTGQNRDTLPGVIAKLNQLLLNEEEDEDESSDSGGEGEGEGEKDAPPDKGTE